jgi:hypothetical protein
MRKSPPNRIVADALCREMQRDCFKLEMAMHEWDNRSLKPKHEMSCRLKELENAGLNAAAIMCPGARFSRNSNIPIIT